MGVGEYVLIGQRVKLIPAVNEDLSVAEGLQEILEVLADILLRSEESRWKGVCLFRSQCVKAPIPSWLLPKSPPAGLLYQSTRHAILRKVRVQVAVKVLMGAAASMSPCDAIGIPSGFDEA